ncbi:uncharacterized protein LOC111261570 isoform X2 [Varroa jacobsoni]|uniref:uncharacterized protein LOC111261570 isoform X2 n=1 Tax=Varroa jacobsoni TaxID=62625 RepID=UPI000BF565E4|nr:uncharacterized protein LOC111261570 isoform X2 [Varroa jacobsoni]
MKSYKTGNLRKQVAEFRGRIERNSAALSNVFQSKQQQQEQLYRRDKILLMEHQAELSAEARKAEEEEEEPNSFCNGIQYLNYRIPWTHIFVI